VSAVKDDYKEDFFYREDWLGEPRRKPEPVVLSHPGRARKHIYGWEQDVGRPDATAIRGKHRKSHAARYNPGPFLGTNRFS
jgi:hypothetical protein